MRSQGYNVSLFDYVPEESKQEFKGDTQEINTERNTLGLEKGLFSITGACQTTQAQGRDCASEYSDGPSQCW